MLSDVPLACDLPRWLSRRMVWRVALSLAVLLVSLAACFLVYERQRILAREIQDAELYARVLQDHADRSFETVEVTLAALDDNVLAAAAARRLPALGGDLRQALQGLAFLRSVSVADAAGLVLTSSNPANVGMRLDPACIAWPPAGAVDRLGTLVFGRDLAGAVGVASGASSHEARSFVPLARAVVLPTGERLFIVAVLNTDDFSNDAERMLAETGRSAALLSVRGELLAATGGLRAMPGESFARKPFFADFLPARESGALIGAGIDGDPVVTAFRTLRKRALVVAVERSFDAVSAQWLQVVGWVAAAVVVMLAVVATLMVMAMRSLRSHQMVSATLAATRDQVLFERESARERLESQLAFTARLLDVSPTPLFVKDLAGRFLTVNRAWLELMDMRLENVVGQTSSELYGEEAPKHLRHDDRLLHSEERVQYENRLLRPGRGGRDTLVTKVRFTDTDGRAAGSVGSIVDVTEFRDAERRIRDARDAAELATRAKSEFIANISHELRTPLQGIIGFSEMGADAAAGMPDLAEMFEDILSSGRRMLTLVNGLLDVSQLDGSLDRATWQACDVVALVREAIEQRAELFRLRGQVLRLHGVEDPIWAHVDGARFRQAVGNVLANANRYAPLDSAIDLTFRRRADDGAEVLVRDRGPGIPADELGAVFEAFVQSSRTRDGSGGTGLGLTIARKIVQGHGGSLTASNAPDGGAVFSICLPATTIRQVDTLLPSIATEVT